MQKQLMLHLSMKRTMYSVYYTKRITGYGKDHRRKCPKSDIMFKRHAIIPTRNLQVIGPSDCWIPINDI